MAQPGLQQVAGLQAGSGAEAFDAPTLGAISAFSTWAAPQEGQAKDDFRASQSAIFSNQSSKSWPHATQ
jgi:hypothetical protein